MFHGSRQEFGFEDAQTKLELIESIKSIQHQRISIGNSNTGYAIQQAGRIFDDLNATIDDRIAENVSVGSSRCRIRTKKMLFNFLEKKNHVHVLNEFRKSNFAKLLAFQGGSLLEQVLNQPPEICEILYHLSLPSFLLS